MKYGPRTFFLVKGDLSCEVIAGDAQSFVLCGDRGYLLREIVPSSTLLVRAGDSVSPVRMLLETQQVSKKELYRHIGMSTPSQMVGHAEADLRIELKLGARELEDAADRMFLLRHSGKVYRMEYRFLLNVALYVRSLRLTKSALETELAIYNEVVRHWALEKIGGVADEVCLLFLLNCWERGEFGGWRKGLEDALLEKVAVGDVRAVVESSSIVQEAKDAILGALG